MTPYAHLLRGVPSRPRHGGLLTALWFATGVVALLTAACSSGDASGALDVRQVEMGAMLYQEHCVGCHGEAATGANALTGAPPAPVHGPSGHTWHHADGQIIEIVLGSYVYPNRQMPPFEGTLTADEVRAVLAYFKTLWTTEQRDFQREVSDNWERLNSSS